MSGLEHKHGSELACSVLKASLDCIRAHLKPKNCVIEEKVAESKNQEFYPI